MWTQLPFGEGLRAALGPPRGPRRLESSPRSRVWRVELAGTPAVVKQLVAGPGAEERYAREVAALRIASRAEPAVVPALLGTDPGNVSWSSRTSTTARRPASGSSATRRHWPGCTRPASRRTPASSPPGADPPRATPTPSSTWPKRSE